MLHERIKHMAPHGNKNQHKANTQVVSIKNEHRIKCSQKLNLGRKLETASVHIIPSSKLLQMFPLC